MSARQLFAMSHTHSVHDRSLSVVFRSAPSPRHCHSREHRTSSVVLLQPFWAASVLLVNAAVALAQPQAQSPTASEDQVSFESELITNPRQLTFSGRRSGEGYFSSDGAQLVFQSEREPGNPFYQIYVLDLETGDIDRVSPGIGKTTCAWFHPTGKQILFASTHEDPDAKKKQLAELQLRETGKQRRYSWDYDENYELYAFDRESKQNTKLTRTRGYDAEGSWSPDGTKIVFASNREAFAKPLTSDMESRFQTDPSLLIDIYLMDANGRNVRRLTESMGYDGGPFFAPNGKRICWRRFSEDGAIAEVMTMNVDGSDQRQLTRLGAMSWAPFYHPSGEYLIFTTNRHGFSNFELYLVDTAGQSEPVRVTGADGFDGLPVFSPSGKMLAWTSNRTSSRQSQLFLATWNHERALELLRVKPTAVVATAEAFDDSSAVVAATASAGRSMPGYSAADIVRHVDYLCRPELEGRRTGTDGERYATAYVAAYFESLGLSPAGDRGDWYQEFEFTSGVSLGSKNRLSWNEQTAVLDQDWRPLAFSANGEFPAAPIVFAGYGIVAPADEGQDEYDSYVHLDVKDKWILALRFMPESISAERRQHLSRYSSLRYKAMVARDRGARGVIFVSGPTSQVKEQLVAMRFDGSLSGTSIPIICVTDDLVDRWLNLAERETLKQLQEKLDTGEPTMGFELDGCRASVRTDVQQEKRIGRNVLARLQMGATESDMTLVIGAHIDHLGKGTSGSSLARDAERDEIHFGADDNASGVAAVLEIAEQLAHERRTGKLSAKRDLIFAAWSGEELGMLGSSHYVKQLVASHEEAHASDHGQPEDDSLHNQIGACLNLDMVGRLRKKLVLQGVGSSDRWRQEIERANVPVGLPLTLQDDGYIPTDASIFYMHGVPILSAFTGSHEDYHSPRDTPNKLNYEGAAQIARLMGLVSKRLAIRDEIPNYVAQTKPEQQRRAHLRAYLGTIPDYAESDIKGVKLSGTAKNGPAAQAGIRSGDVIVELAGKKIENIYDYTYAIEALKIGKTTSISIQRKGRIVKLKVTPGSRE